MKWWVGMQCSEVILISDGGFKSGSYEGHGQLVHICSFFIIKLSAVRVYLRELAPKIY